MHVTTFRCERTFVATVSRAERSLTVTPRSLVMNSHSSTRRIARRAHVHKAHVGGHVPLVRIRSLHSWCSQEFGPRTMVC